MSEDLKQRREFGRSVGAFYLGMREAGVEREDAIGIICKWMRLAAVKLPQENMDEIVKKLMKDPE